LLDRQRVPADRHLGRLGSVEDRVIAEHRLALECVGEFPRLQLGGAKHLLVRPRRDAEHEPGSTDSQ
jgi:hypothetical protein